MSSTSTTWTTDTNTKSGVVQIYSSNVSILKILGIEGGDSILELFADEGDTNSDKWRLWVNDADDDFHFANYTSGSWADLLTIQDGGNVGIATDAPSSKLHVVGSSSLDGAVVINDSSADVDFRVESNGNANMLFVDGGNDRVGIGTAAPACDLHIGGTNPQIRIGDDGAEDTSLCFMGNAQDFYIALDDTTDDLTIGTGTTIGSNVKMVVENGGNVGIGETAPGAPLHIKKAATTASSPFELLRLEVEDGGVDLVSGMGASIDFYMPHDSASFRGAYIAAQKESSPDDAESIGLRFGTCANGATVQTNMVLDEDGNLGIGTTSPVGTLTINASSLNPIASLGGQSNYALVIQGSDTTDEGRGIAFGGNGSSDVGAAIIAIDKDSGAKGDLAFYTKQSTSSSANPVEAMRIDDAGNVGIAHTAPPNTLSIGANVSGKSHFIEISTHSDSVQGIVFSNNNSGVWQIRNNSDPAGELGVYDYGDGSVATHLDTTDTVWQTGSDLRIKKDINNIDSVLDSINALRPITWKRKYGKADRIYSGLVAQEVLPHFPLVVSGVDKIFKEIPAKDAVLDDEGNVIEEATSLTYEGAMSIGYSNFVPYLIKAIQELSAKVTALENA